MGPFWGTFLCLLANPEEYANDAGFLSLARAGAVLPFKGPIQQAGAPGTPADKICSRVIGSAKEGTRVAIAAQNPAQDDAKTKSTWGVCVLHLPPAL